MRATLIIPALLGLAATGSAAVVTTPTSSSTAKSSSTSTSVKSSSSSSSVKPTSTSTSTVKVSVASSSSSAPKTSATSAASSSAAKVSSSSSTSTSASACATTPVGVCTKLPGLATGLPTAAMNVKPDTSAAFRALDYFFERAANAVTPGNYIRHFQNYDGASQGSGFLTSSFLGQYDPAQCAAICDSTSKCVSFNIYFERDPTLLPDNKCCPNPASMTTIKCGLWGNSISSQVSNDKGSLVSNFTVMVAGSNGYNKINTTPTSIAVKTGSPITESIAASATPCTNGATPLADVEVTFNVNRTTIYGETIFIAGSIPQLGSWIVDNATALSSYGYAAGHENWYVALSLPAGESFSYKYYQRNTDSTITWEREQYGYRVPTGCTASVVQNDKWVS